MEGEVCSGLPERGFLGVFWGELLEVGSFSLLYMEERLCFPWSNWQSQGKPFLRENDPTEGRVKSGIKWVLKDVV